MEIMFTRSELSRAQREMIAVVVSASNNCEYCQIHHVEALNHYWKNDEKVELLRKDFTQLELEDQDLLLCKYAKHLTVEPGEQAKGVLVDEMKSIGLSDSAILDATLVVSYFNFVNRIVLSLGVEVEKVDGFTGYKY